MEHRPALPPSPNPSPPPEPFVLSSDEEDESDDEPMTPYETMLETVGMNLRRRELAVQLRESLMLRRETRMNTMDEWMERIDDAAGWAELHNRDIDAREQLLLERENVVKTREKSICRRENTVAWRENMAAERQKNLDRQQVNLHSQQQHLDAQKPGGVMEPDEDDKNSVGSNTDK